MDTGSGEFISEAKVRLLDAQRPEDLESFEYGEVIQVKSGFFEVVKVDMRSQRLVLKPIPKPISEG